MSPAEILALLVPQALKLAIQSLLAIAKGDHEKAARKAEEAARRQGVKLAAEETLQKKQKKK